jgi:hypothetical protein
MKVLIFLFPLLALAVTACDENSSNYPDCGFEVVKQFSAPSVRTSAEHVQVFIDPGGPNRPHDTVALIRHCLTHEYIGPENDDKIGEARGLASSCGGDAVVLTYASATSQKPDGSPGPVQYIVKGSVLRWM